MRQALPQKKPPPRSCWRCARYLTNQINSSLTEIDHTGEILDGLYPGQTEATPAPSARELSKLGKDGWAAMVRLGQSYPQLEG